ncbi:MAG: hypothetical protein ACK521_07165 [bacterium]|jgi:hypothetical protein
MNASEIMQNNYASNYNSQTTDSIRLLIKESYQKFNYGDVLNAMRDTNEIENERRLTIQKLESEDFAQYLLSEQFRDKDINEEFANGRDRVDDNEDYDKVEAIG